MMKTKKDKNWLRNRNATKNPKLFTISLMRDEKGNFHAIGHQSMVLDRSGNREEWDRVITRDLIRLINQQGINAR